MHTSGPDKADKSVSALSTKAPISTNKCANGLTADASETNPADPRLALIEGLATAAKNAALLGDLKAVTAISRAMTEVLGQTTQPVASIAPAAPSSREKPS